MLFASGIVLESTTLGRIVWSRLKVSPKLLVGAIHRSIVQSIDEL